MGPRRPAFLARDSSGKSVSLLNNEILVQYHDIRYESAPFDMVRSHSSISKGSSSPPSLIRESSYESRQDYPLTPTSDYLQSPTQPSHLVHFYPPLPQALDNSVYPLSPLAPQYTTTQYQPRSSSPSAPSVSGSFSTYQPSQADRAGTQKKYECKYRIQHNCDQTFTTSGHASRHSKIHDSLKGIACTHPGCSKKFTRSDNMKQHLETHNKGKKREKALTKTAGISKLARPSSRASNASADLEHRTKGLHIRSLNAAAGTDEGYIMDYHPPPISSGGCGALDMLAEAAGQTDLNLQM